MYKNIPGRSAFCRGALFCLEAYAAADALQRFFHILVRRGIYPMDVAAFVLADRLFDADHPHRLAVPLRGQGVDWHIVAGGDLRLAAEIVPGHLQLQQNGVMAAILLNAAGDYVVSYIVERFVTGKDWLQKKLAGKTEAAE